MKEGWEYKKLGECFISINNGANIKQIKGAKGIPVTRIETLSNDKFNRERMGYADILDASPYSSYILNDGDILMSHINSMKFLGRAVQYSKKENETIIHGMNLLRLVPTKDVLSSFLVYQFYTAFFRNQIVSISHQSVNQASFNTTNLKNLKLKVPTLSEQQSIVDYLDSAFAKIDAMKANAEKRLNEAQALFQASLKKMLEPKEGWEDKALKDFATDMYRGSGVKRDQVTEDGISCVRYGEIYTKYNYHFNECDSHTLEEYVNSPKYFEYGDILFAITGESVEEIGKSIAYTGKDKCIAGGDIVVMKHNYEPRYISYALSTPSAIKQKGRGKTKLKVVHTNIPSLKEIIIPIAPVNEQIIIADTLDSLKSKVDRLQENYDKISQECDALKQAILRQVFE